MHDNCFVKNFNIKREIEVEKILEINGANTFNFTDTQIQPLGNENNNPSF